MNRSRTTCTSYGEPDGTLRAVGDILLPPQRQGEGGRISELREKCGRNDNRDCSVLVAGECEPKRGAGGGPVTRTGE